MKKQIAVFLSALMLIGAALSFAGCGGNYSETFRGKLSADTYETTDTAATAFLENEIAASDTSVSFLSYTKTEDITDEELAAFDLGEVKAEDIAAKEWGKIEYRAAATSASSLAEQSEGTLTATVGMFKIGDAYRYFVPVAGTGEMISKSYFESVFDAEKYKNCTADYEMTLEYEFSVGGQSMDMEMDLDVTQKITETAAMIDMEIVVSMKGQGNAKTNYTFYLVNHENSVVAYMENGGVWQSASLPELSSWDKLYEMELKDFVDHSYFEKTSTGFKLAPIKFDKYIRNYFAAANDSTFDFDIAANAELSGEATYFVTEGRLSKATVKLSADFSEQSGGYLLEANVSTSASNKFYDFGSTKVELPSGLREIVG